MSVLPTSSIGPDSAPAFADSNCGHLGRDVTGETVVERAATKAARARASNPRRLQKLAMADLEALSLAPSCS
eukprot:tig00000269_g23768.t1